MPPFEKKLFVFVVLPLTAYLLIFMGFAIYRAETEPSFQRTSGQLPVLRPSNEGGLYQSRAVRVDTRLRTE